jgi:hypothetical protein
MANSSAGTCIHVPDNCFQAWRTEGDAGSSLAMSNFFVFVFYYATGCGYAYEAIALDLSVVERRALQTAH